MPNSSSETAILLFTRQAAGEAAAKSFTPHSRKINVKVASTLINQTLATVRQTQIPVFISSGDEFSGQGFGPKVTAAIASVFGKGFTKILVIGNDCPTLTPTLLLKARASLETNALVLGPATDGGVYLIGLTKAAFLEKKFCGLPWQTDQVFSGLRQYASELELRVSCLPMHQDVDQEADLKKIILRFGARNPLLQKLISLLSSFSTTVLPAARILQTRKGNLNLPNRAPPLAQPLC